jgi:acetolactate synthase-1/2/3 large subunit
MDQRHAPAPEAGGGSTAGGGSWAGPTVAERLITLLEEAGVEVVFGVGGTHTLAVLGALERRGRPRFLPVKNEQACSYAALAYARATGRPGVCLTSTGPGALNALSGIAEARLCATPMLHITSHVNRGAYSAAVHESPFQTGTLELVGAAVFDVADVNIDGPFWRAWRRCTGGTAPGTGAALQPGPVSLELAAHTLTDPAVTREANPANDDLPWRPMPLPDLGQVAGTLTGAKRPVLYAGGGVRTPAARAAMEELALRAGTPIVTSIQGKQAAGWSHPLYLGPWAAEQAVHDLFGDADCALVIGSKLSGITTAQWTLPLPAATFRIDASPAEHGRYPGLVPVQGDAGEVCRALSAHVYPARPGRTELAAGIRQAVRASARHRAPAECTFLRALSGALPADALIALDVNKASFWAAKFLPAPAHGTQVFSSYLCLGSSLPMGIGLAAAARPGQLVTIMVGDGGLQLSLSELATVAELEQPVALIVFVDGLYGLLRDNGARPGVRGAEELGVRLKNPSFRGLAEAFGLGYRHVAEPRQVGPALDGINSPTLVEVREAFSRNW